MNNLVGTKDKDAFSFEDLCYQRLSKLQDLRTDNSPNFQSGITAFECLLKEVVDNDADIQLNLLEIKRETALQSGYSVKEVDKWYFDEKFTILCGLSIRNNAGPFRVREWLNQSEFIGLLHKNIQDGIGQVCSVTGRQGSGKSYSCLAVAIEFLKAQGRTLNWKNVCFDLRTFLKQYNDIEQTPPGSVLILEEIGVNANSKDALTKRNKIFTKVFQTIRTRELLVLYNSPDLSFIDVSLRKQAHFWVECEKYDKKLGYARVKPHAVKVNQRTGELMFPYLLNSYNMQVSEMRIPKLSDTVSAKYEGMQKEYKDRLGKVAEQDFIELDAKDYKKVQEIEADEQIFALFCQKRDEGMQVKDIIQELNMSNKLASSYNKQYILGKHKENETKP